MKFKSIILFLWLTINLILIGRYYFDSNTIRCEPCLPGAPCPPCQTDYMANFLKYLIGWNLTLGITYIILIKKSKRAT
jgi:hypothetical protein